MSEVLSSLHSSTTQDNPPKHKSNALPSCIKLLLDAVISTYECQQGVSEIPPREGANCRCNCDGYRPDTLRVGIGVLRDFLEQELQSSDTSIVSCSFKGVLQHLLDMVSINKLHIPRWENTLADLLIGA